MQSIDPDIIAAIATAPGRAGVGIVRISGKSLSEFTRRLIGGTAAPRYATRALFKDAQGRPIDDGLLLFFPAPASYTGEDVLELQAHGSPVVLQMLLQRCLELGARLAEPGEFTRRAFLNDKLDLAQAEAVADLIDANTQAAARSAVRSLRGDFSEAIHELVRRLINLRMLVEATLDFPEEDIDPVHHGDAQRQLEEIRALLALIQRNARQGALLRNGLHVVLAGQPNVGKSSLLNRLAGEELAIVTAIPGTTRDTVRQAIEIEGVPLNIVDTAGLREATDEVERLGIQRTWTEIERADVLLLLVDARMGLTEEEERIVQRLPSGLKRVVVHNKIDLLDETARVEPDPSSEDIYISAKQGAGIDLLRQRMLQLVGWEPAAEDSYIARERHLAALAAAEACVSAASQTQAAEFLADELRRAQGFLNAITGEFSADDLLGEIFSRFCIGK